MAYLQDQVKSGELRSSANAVRELASTRTPLHHLVASADTVQQSETSSGIGHWSAASHTAAEHSARAQSRPSLGQAASTDIRSGRPDLGDAAERPDRALTASPDVLDDVGVKAPVNQRHGTVRSFAAAASVPIKDAAAPIFPRATWAKLKKKP